MDELTGLPTHLELPAWLAGIGGRVAHPGPSAILFDIVGMTWINQAEGNRGGDAQLARLGSWLAGAAARYGGRAFRVAGEEFLFVLPSLSLEEARAAAGEVVAEVAAQRIPWTHPDEPRDFLALNAVVFTARQGFEEDLLKLREACAGTLYEARGKDLSAHSVVATMPPNALDTPSRFV